jgi:hypothetical protein
MSSSTNPKKRDWKHHAMDNYAKRIVAGSKDASQNQCAHCKLQFPGARALSAHERRCSSKNSVSTNKVNKSTVEKHVRVLDELLAMAAVTDDDECCAEDEERLVVFDEL